MHEKEIKEESTERLKNYLERVKCSCPSPHYGNCFNCQNTGYCEDLQIVELIEAELKNREKDLNEVNNQEYNFHTEGRL